MEKSFQTSTLILMLQIYNFLFLVAAVADLKPEFYYNTVSHGGSNGGVLLTLKGRGFAKNQFTFGTGNEHLGNKVVLTSESKTFPCDIHPDGNTETQITCYTRPMPQGRYYIRISVDGELIPDANICGGRLDSSSCTHRVWKHYTPLFNELKTISGPPGSMVKIVGRIFTSRFGSNLGPASNGRSESILRIYGGGNICELKDLENDKFYGIGMTSYNWGYMNCKLQGRFIGSFNVSFLISGRFGRSLPKADLLKVSSGGKIYLFQTYAEILSVYPKEGSLMGGTLLTIKGRNFDETTAKARVFVGDTSCKIVKPVTNDIIICRVAPKPAILPNLHAGNRGIQMESWTKNVGNDINNLFALNSTSPTYNNSWIDKGEFYASGEFGARLRAFFQPMYEGLHSLSSSSTGYKQIRLSNNESESNMKLINNGHVAYLKKSKRYYMEITYVNTDNRQNGMIQLQIFSFNSSVNNRETGLAQNAQQQVSICAETVKEIQVIKLDNLTEVAPVDEIQELRVTKPFHVGKDAMFKLIFGGTATVPLSSNAIPLDVQKALENLPMIGSGNVLVTANFTVNSAIYFIFLKLDVGNLPLIGVETISDKNGNNLTVSVKLNFNGTASNKQFAFYLDNVMSPVLPVDAPEQMVKNALDEMFRVRCQNFITAPNKNTIFRNDFELTSDSDHNGQKIYDKVPFCGKSSVRNPKYIFRKEQIKNVYLENYPTMCAAFRGDVNINLEVKLMYRFPSATKAQSKQQYIATYLTHIDDWKYICFDILKSVKVNGAVLHLLESIDIKRITTKEDLYIDSIILTKIAQKEEASVLANAMVRQLPPLSNILSIKELQVKKLGRSLYRITLESYNCTDNLSLFQTLPNKLTLNRSESVTTIPVNQLPAGVWRLQAASPPLGGSIRLLFRNEESADIPVWASKEEMEYYLEAMPTMGKMNVDIEGNCSCKTYTIEWITNPGHKDMLTLIKTNITGINVTSSVKITRYGGYYMKPVPGEHFRTIHNKPQVTAFINDISTALASGGDASFEWTMAATPTIINVNPSQGPVPINITITGSGFNSSSISSNNVTIDGQDCKILVATTAQIVCTLFSCSMGTHDVIVVVDGKGIALAHGNTGQFTGAAKILSVDPVQGSYEGGTKLTIKGYGFSPDMVVKMDEDHCEQTVITSSEIKCITSAQKNSRQTRSVRVKLNNQTQFESGTNFTYTTPDGNVTHVNVSVAKVTGGEPILLTGTNLENASNLEIGHVPANILSSNTTNVLAIMPAQDPGVHDIHLTISNGYAAISGPVKSINQALFINSVNPDRGSLFGGTRLTITGKGFAVPHAMIKVKVGSVSCNVEKFSNSWIRCMIEHTAKTYDITNPGIHPEYKKDEKEKVRRMFLKVGDSIRWLWSVPIWLRSTDFHVFQIDNLFSGVPVENGFKSGNKSNNDMFIHQFTKAGTYYFWGGAVDLSEGIRGVIYVKQRRSHSEIVNVTVNNFEAEHQINNTGIPSLPLRNNCSAQSSVIDFCNENKTVVTMKKISFYFSECSTSIVTSMSPYQLTSLDEIILKGKRFSTRQCENIIEFGKYLCVPKAQNTSHLTCSVDVQNFFSVGVLLSLKARVDNRGYALIDIPQKDAKSIVLLPHIERIIPKMGSTSGGTKLTILGGGFKFDNSTVQVFIGSTNCKVHSVSYKEIVCETLPGKGSDHLVQLVVNSSGHQIPAICKINSNCTFSYSGIITPNVTSVSPANVSTSDVQFIIEGRGFGTNSADIKVTIGTTNCLVNKVNHSHISCQADYLGAGWNTFNINRVGIGNMAVGNLSVWSHPYVSKVHPPIGSLHGGTVLTIYGNGFVNGHTSIKIGKKECKILMTNQTQVQCSTLPNSMGIQLLIVMSNGQPYVPHIFIYATSHTPNIVSVSPLIGKVGNILTIIGSGFNETAANTVTVGSSICVVGFANANSLNCTLGHQTAGKYPVTVNVDGKGLTNNVMFTYQLSLSGISPITGSLFGGQRLTLTGSGFDANRTKVMICSQQCLNPDPNIQSDTTFICITPTLATNWTTQNCVVNVSVADFHAISTQNYQYSTNKTSHITRVYPSRGGTRGGTNITISGTGFSSNKDDIEVSIDQSKCTVLKAESTEIVCQTTAHLNSMTAKVEVTIKGQGLANNTFADFTFIDVWSSRSTWGNNDPPGKGEFVVIGKGQKVLLDTDTPILKMLLIQGGTLEFEEKDIELNAENILITDGGRFQVGSEKNPFQHKAVITLYGNLRAKELPIYGAKTLAVREGILDLHGRKLGLTWTHLAVTANRGDNFILLKQAVPDWKVGDQIVIASTSGRHSQKENEMHTIAAISSDYRNLTLTEKLAYQHVSVEEVVDGHKLEFCAEVGLLSRNVIVRGSVQKQWSDEIEACPDGFNTGEFATQTCFQGRFGEEMGSAQFGAQIMVHAPIKDKNLAIARLAYLEVTHAGQAFRLGRYPVHFHLNGDMSRSYIRGCAIHHTFNRAINIHGSHRTLVEHNVVYNIMGGAIFLEDGIETENVFQYNLAVFVKPSTSLRNDDVTPASFWITNPNNIVRNNAAAGGSHFGYWFRMLQHPEGPSSTSSICPRNVPLGIFQNNSAHSFGWFGLWIFPSFTPRENGRCNYWKDKRVVFEKMTAWNCEKGAETVDSGPLQMDNFVLVNNEFAGFEGKVIVRGPQYTQESIMIKNSLIVGKSSVLTSKPTQTAVVLPFGNGLIIQNVTFVNFNNQSTAFGLTSVDGHCLKYCGGFLYQTSGLKFINTTNKAIFRWEDEMILHDKDGTLTGTAQSKVLATTGLLPPTCTKSEHFSSLMPASICPPDVKFHRFAFNKIYPSNLKRRDLLVINKYGNTSAPYKFKAVTHKEGWMVLLVDGIEHKISFLGASQVTNISYDASFYQFYSGDYVLITQNKESLPDRFTIDGKNTFISRSLKMPTYQTGGTGDWFYNSEAKTMTYLVSYKASLSRSKRSASLTSSKDRSLRFAAFRCFYLNCEPPKDPRLSPPKTKRPNTFYLWSMKDTWSKVNKLLNSNTHARLPTENDNVTIPEGMWVVADTSIPKLNALHLYGQLEISNDLPKITLSASYIYIRGGRLILGWENKPYPGEAIIELKGTKHAPSFPVNSGPNLGSSFIGVFGGLDLHGKERVVHWTRLATTLKVGEKIVNLQKVVDWKLGEEIVVASTSYNAWETETFRIFSISADRKSLTLNTTALYEHIVHNEIISDKTVILSAEVGLLTRNIKIIGSPYENMEREMFGARIIAGVTQTSIDSLYVGYIRLSNVEFMHTGQYGWATSSDPRYSLVFHNLGTIDHVLRPTYVKNCTFHHGFSSAIGVYGSNSMNIENNVIYRTLGSAIISESDNIKVRNNLITLVVCPAVYIVRFNLKGGINWPAGIESIKGKDFEIRDNVVAGSERFGYHVTGEYCNKPSKWFNNYVRGALLGVGQFPKDSDILKKECVLYSGFYVFRCVDAGIYHNQNPGFNLENSVLGENSVSLCPFVIGPMAITHKTSSKKIAIRNTVFVGLTASYDCNIERLDKTNPNILLSNLARSGTDGRTIGFMWPTFLSNGNNAPEKPLFNIMSYPTISGLMIVENVTFAHFNHQCGNKMKTIVLITAGFNDDGQHPVVTRKIKKTDVKSTNLVFIQRPNIGKINSADCVDMDCDGMKKALLVDEDGSFVGGLAPVSVFSQSEWEWNGDKRRGLGDYRIPKVMLTSMNGSRLPIDKVAPHKGIIRNSKCMYESSWQAYKCTNSSYAMLIVESLDEDTETRRLSPVAILGNGYLDLINGPQDHGWCSGYTCRKRLSTFMVVVELGKIYNLYFSSTSPQKLRLHLLNTYAKITVSIYFSNPNRLDVYVDTQTYVPPKDKKDKTSFGISNLGKYKPLPSDTVGTNYFDHDTKQLYVTLQGGRPVDIRMTPVIVIKFSLSSITDSMFFGKQLIRNLALFLEVPASKVRIVSIDNESSSSGSRKKRSTNSGLTVTIQIGEPPVTTITANSTSNVTNSSSTLSTSDLSRISSQIVNAQQLNTLGQAINYSVSNMLLTPATVPVSDPVWTAQNTATSFTVKVPDSLKIMVSPEASYEGGIFKIGPCLRFYTIFGVPLDILGTPSDPWKLRANLVYGSGSDPKALLLGKTEIDFKDGWANFTTLSISHKGTNYGLEFIVVYPVAAKFNATVSPSLTVPRRPLTLSLTPNPLGVIANKDVDLKVFLKDNVTGLTVHDSRWRGHSWSATAVLIMPYLYRGQVENLGNEATYDSTDNCMVFSKVSFSKAGIYILQITMISTPKEYTIVREEEVQVLSNIPTANTNTITTLIKLMIDIDYHKIENGNVNYFRVLMINYFMYKFPEVHFKNVAVSKSDNGKVNVHMDIYGHADAVISTSKSLCNMAENQERITFQSEEAYIVFSTQVNGTRYLDSNCGDLKGKIVPKNQFPVEIIIGVSFAVIFILFVTIIFLVWRFQVVPKAKIDDSSLCRQPSSKEPVYIAQVNNPTKDADM